MSQVAIDDAFHPSTIKSSFQPTSIEAPDACLKNDGKHDGKHAFVSDSKESLKVMQHKAADTSVVQPQESSRSRLTIAPHLNADDLQPGILHIGTGHFALAHIAAYVDAVLAAGDHRWGIVATSLRSGALCKQLRASGGQHLLVECMSGKSSGRLMRSVVDVLLPEGKADPFAVALADPRIRMMTATITITGFYFTGPDQLLDLAHADLQHDLTHPATPITVYGFFVAGLWRRFQRSPSSTLTVLLLDNLENNGAIFQRAVVQFVEASKVAADGKRALLAWMSEHVDFVCSMVDRITPGVDEDRALALRREFSVESHVPVIVTEPFKELVHTRSRFPMPAWKAYGVRVVSDCAQDWRRKGFLLNAGHHVIGTMANRLGGMELVNQSVRDPSVHRMLVSVQDDMCTFLTACGESYNAVQEYAASVRERFSNTNCPDTIERISARSTSKTSLRILGALLDYHTRLGVVPSTLTLQVALWLLNVAGVHENPSKIRWADPCLEKLAFVRALWGTGALAAFTEEAVRSVIARIGADVHDVHFAQAATTAPFIEKLAAMLRLVVQRGTRGAVDAVCQVAAATGPRKHHLLLDCDGTLVDSEPLAFEAVTGLVNRYLLGRGVKAEYKSSELLQRFVGMSFRRIITQLVEQHGLPALSSAELDGLAKQENDAVTELLARRVQACDGAAKALVPLAKRDDLRLAVVTSSAGPRVSRCLEVTGLHSALSRPPVFSAVTSLPAPRSKPDASVYLHAMATLGAHPHDCVSVEDSVNGCLAGVRSGCAVVAYVGSVPAEEREALAMQLHEVGALEVMHHWSEFAAIAKRRGWWFD